jgi:hypothetical protein
LVIIIDIKSL